MKRKLAIALLYGGESGEHEVSRISACSVYNHINRDLYEVSLIGITQEGDWFLQSDPGNCEKSLPIVESEELRIHITPGSGFATAEKPVPCDFVFPVLHGTFGEDGTVQGMLELMHLPYAGSGVTGSAAGMDKVISKRIWDNCGIPVVPFTELNRSLLSDEARMESRLDRIEQQLSYPLFVKPVNAGSSVGASRAADRDSLKKAIREAFRYDSRILVEICINAREIECAVLGNEEPLVFNPGEITATHEFYDYDAKYNDPEGAKLSLRADLNDKVTNDVKEMACRAYSAVMAEGFARVDFFIDRDSRNIYINEINTLPGFTHVSMFPKMCEAGGIEYSRLIDRIIELGLERHREKAKSRTAR